MSVVYALQTHRDPEQIYRLVRTLRRGSPTSHIVVQHDGSTCPLDWAPLSDVPRTYALPSAGPRIRTHFSAVVQPFLDCLAWLDRQRIDYDWIVNLTGQDYPVMPVETIEAQLGAASCDGYLRYWDVESADSPWGRHRPKARYGYRYRRWPDSTMGALRALKPITRVLPVNFYLTYGPWVGVRTRTPFHDGFRCYGGWAWFSIRRAAADYFQAFLAERPDVLAHYRTTVAPDESIVQTVLVNSGRFRLVNDNLRYIDYDGTRDGAPRVLGVADLPLLSTGRHHFARKFDIHHDAAILDRIDAELLARTR